MGFRSKICITGASGFTGNFLASLLEEYGLDIFRLKSDLLDFNELVGELKLISPDYVIHLAAKSFAASSDILSYYDVNVIGTENLLKALTAADLNPKKVIITSSASVYGTQIKGKLDESLYLKPCSHYGCSKLAMECLSQNYTDNLNILIVRPFNYTGPNQNSVFLIPKILAAYKTKQNSINLGNTDNYREFNDIRDVCEIYRELLFSDTKYSGNIVNIASGRAVCIGDIIDYCNSKFDVEMNIVVDSRYIRTNDIKYVVGSIDKLDSFIKYKFKYSYKDTINYMLE